MKKKIFAILFFVMLITCTAVFADDLEDVKQAGVLRFGHHMEYIPFVFEDSNGDTSGIDIALMEEIARRLGVRLQTIPLAWDGILDSLNINQVDVIGGGLARTDERLAKIDFSRPYYSAETVFISMPSLNKPASVTLESFRGMKIAVEKGSSYESWIQENLVTPGIITAADVYDFSSMPDQIKALENGTVNLVVMAEDLYMGLYKNTGKYQIFSDNFMIETFAFGLRKGSTLTQAVNDQLTAMIKDGTAQNIANRFFTMNFNEIVELMIRPQATVVPVVTVTAVPNPVSCVNGMAFDADVTIPDGTIFSRGQGFRKTWRVRNTGTCTWNSDYTFSLASGTSMGTNVINIPGTVAPGQTVNLSVDLFAPNAAGNYKGNWQMKSPQGASFGQVLWVNIRVIDGQPVQPTATPRTAQPVIDYFYADPGEGDEGMCTNVYWSARNSTGLTFYINGAKITDTGSLSGGTQLCDPVTRAGSYEFKMVAHSKVGDISSSFWYTTKESGQKPVIPVINYFYADPTEVIMNSCTTVYWSVSNPIIGIEIFTDGVRSVNTTNASGSAQVCAPNHDEGYHEVRLVAHSITDDASDSTYFNVLTTPAPNPMYDDYSDEDDWLDYAITDAITENLTEEDYSYLFGW